MPLGQYALDALLEYAGQYEDRWERKPEGISAVFLSMGLPDPNAENAADHHQVVTKSGIKKHVNPHCFRHNAATHMLENGADLRTIQTLLGHATIMTTEIYTHVGTKKLKTVHSNTHSRA